jgi:hypothetical protein
MINASPSFSFYVSLFHIWWYHAITWKFADIRDTPMKAVNDDNTSAIQLLTNCSADVIRDAREQIVASGALGKSVVYVSCWTT